MNAPDRPIRRLPDADSEHYDLYRRAREALYAVPIEFTSTINIAGVPATDIFNLNAILGASIEERVVDTLNAMRGVWDPNDRYALYSFVRQSQTFPDVLLRRVSDPHDTLLGIELKGWYLLAKEGEPSFRFTASPRVCAPQDLFVVYPWHLSEVISGTPRLMAPFVEPAQYVATFRNHHWQFEMNRRSGAAGVTLSTVATPYPVKSDAISDRANDDAGRNFGRIARTGVMNDFTSDVRMRQVSGIPVNAWHRFFSAFKESATAATVAQAIDRRETQVRRDVGPDDTRTEEVLTAAEAFLKAVL